MQSRNPSEFAGADQWVRLYVFVFNVTCITLPGDARHRWHHPRSPH
jgi:hypothetical protein